MNVYDVLIEREHKEIVIAILLQHGFSSFEEISDGDEKAGFRIWTGPDLDKAQVHSWFDMPVEVIAHTPAAYSIDVAQYSDRFRLVNDPTQVLDDTDICLVSGAGFGWGEHETTQMGLSYLWRFHPGKLRGKRVLDFGAGTGILGLAAQCCNAAFVEAIEIDDAAVHTLQLNISANQGVTEFKCDTRLTQESSTYELILANVYLDVLIAILPDLCVRLAPEGTLWVSGFPTARQDDIIHLAEQCDCKLMETAQIGSWASASFTRKDKGERNRS